MFYCRQAAVEENWLDFVAVEMIELEEWEELDPVGSEVSLHVAEIAALEVLIAAGVVASA